MSQAKFFHQLAAPMEIFINLKRPRRNEQQDRQLTITFRMGLNGNTIRSAPKFVQSAYAEIQNGADMVGLKKEFDNVNVELFNISTKKRCDFKLPRLHLEHLSVKEVKNSEGDVSTVLCFETEYPFDTDVWSYLGDHYATTVWAKFDSAQASLVDLEEADEKGEDVPADTTEEVEEEEAEEEAEAS